MARKSRVLISIVPHNAMDLDQLKQMDLKDFDLPKLIKFIDEHRNSIIKFGVILAALAMLLAMYNNYQASSLDVHAKIAQMQGKLEAVKVRDQAALGLNGFKSALPKKINEFELITMVSKYAKLYHVTIASLSPAESKDMGIYDLINLNFNAEFDNFKDLMPFLRKIENSSSYLRVNSWSGHELDDGRINFDTEISAVNIHT